MKRTIGLAAGLALAWTASPAWAEAPPPDWQGVWQGTLGGMPVRACFDARDGLGPTGSYFYMSKLAPIGLQKREAAGEWMEGYDESATGRWTIANQGRDRMTGQWRHRQRSLPIALTRVAAAEEEEGVCASREYSAPRIRPVVVRQKPASKNGLSYTELTYDVGPAFPEVSLVSFALRESQPGDRAINAALRLDPGNSAKPGDYVSCSRSQLAMHGTDGPFFVEYSPELVTAEFVSAAVSEGGDCGGAHPFSSQSHLTFDRRSGGAIDLVHWFTLRGVSPRAPDDRSTILIVAPALRAVILRHTRFEDAECRDAVKDEEYYDAGLAPNGLAFTASLPHAAQACETTGIVPFAALAPFLSEAGRAGAARLGWRGR